MDYDGPNKPQTQAVVKGPPSTSPAGQTETGIIDRNPSHSPKKVLKIVRVRVSFLENSKPV